MKHIFIIILLWPLINFSQMPDTCFTENEIISQQETLISELENIIILDSVEIMYINHKSKLLNDNIELYIEREKYLKPKWYDNKFIWFSSGILTTLLTGKMIVEVVQ